MRITKPKCYRRLTASEILEIIRDQHRQQCQFDPEADREAVIRPEMMGAEWRGACDLVGWQKLGRARNDYFHTGKKILKKHRPRGRRTNSKEQYNPMEGSPSLRGVVELPEIVGLRRARSLVDGGPRAEGKERLPDAHGTSLAFA